MNLRGPKWTQLSLVQKNLKKTKWAWMSLKEPKWMKWAYICQNEPKCAQMCLNKLTF